MNQSHSFHMIMMSPWPIMMGSIVFSGFLGFSLFLMKKNNYWFLAMIILIAMVWWRDVGRESTWQGYHSSFVCSNMRYGMIFFIISEILFFFSFFWGFFHSSLSPNIELGNLWPPPQIEKINPFDVPLLNTIILLSSGITVTISHHCLVINNLSKSMTYLMYTIMLGIYFSAAQMFEYWDSSYMMSDSSFSSCFFMATGFHGFHVIVGTIFLYAEYFRLNFQMMNYYHHIGMESSIWYWHFVDVVWLFLFTFIYWWSY